MALRLHYANTVLLYKWLPDYSTTQLYTLYTLVCWALQSSTKLCNALYSTLLTTHYSLLTTLLYSTDVPVLPVLWGYHC